MLFDKLLDIFSKYISSCSSYMHCQCSCNVILVAQVCFSSQCLVTLHVSPLRRNCYIWSFVASTPSTFVEVWIRMHQFIFEKQSLDNIKSMLLRRLEPRHILSFSDLVYLVISTALSGLEYVVEMNCNIKMILREKKKNKNVSLVL